MYTAEYSNHAIIEHRTQKYGAKIELWYLHTRPAHICRHRNSRPTCAETGAQEQLPAGHQDTDCWLHAFPALQQKQSTANIITQPQKNFDPFLQCHRGALQRRALSFNPARRGMTPICPQQMKVQRTC
mmetsp:Transcript_7410/g.19773  ORF Transcript_7410/g.19773 Transcript_7410/m.19773 type:complete len:128 (+) Transcript_7410:286-669(+)|eukprot:1157730-Pelagomonas_calceolata.AAC.1